MEFKGCFMRGIAKLRTLALISSLPLSVGLAQGSASILTIEHRASCATCSVSLERLFTLGTSSDSLLLAGGHLERDSYGRFYAVAVGMRAVAVFDPSGRPERGVGRPGQGPGEFQSDILGVVVTAGDSLRVIDIRGRVSVFGPRGAFARAYQMPVPNITGTTFLPGGRSVIGKSLNTPAGIGLPYHLISDSGTVIRSFGTEIVGASGRGTQVRPFIVSADMKSLFGWQRGADYVFEWWELGDFSGTTVRVVGAPWFVMPKPAKPAPPGFAKAGLDAIRNGQQPPALPPEYRGTPGSTISILRVDSLGRAWVLGEGPDPKTPDTKVRMLDVIDLSKRSLLLSQPVGASFRFFRDTDIAYQSMVDGDGIVTYAVYRLRRIGF